MKTSRQAFQNKYIFLFVFAFIIMIAGTGLNSCDLSIFPEEDKEIHVTTLEADSIQGLSAISGVNVTVKGDIKVTAIGICYSYYSNPTVETGIVHSTNKSSGTYSVRMNSISRGSTYYVRAFAVIKKKLGFSYYDHIEYGNQISFKIDKDIPKVSISEVYENSSYRSRAWDATLESDGGDPVLEIGVCWGLTHNPTVDQNKVTGQLGVYRNILTVSNLPPSTTCYFRAYAINSTGIAYSRSMTFTTFKRPVATTTDAYGFRNASAVSGGKIDASRGLRIIAHGICWDLNPNPDAKLVSKTIVNKTITDNTLFEASISNLTPEKRYFYRSFFINELDTIYGDEKTFLTMPQLTDIDGNVYDLVQIGTQIWTVQNLRVSHYNDGTEIPLERLKIDSYNWRFAVSGLRCAYDDQDQNVQKFGYLYNWFTVETGKLAPPGWRVPTLADFEKLANYLGGVNIAGDKLKESGTVNWKNNNNGTNSSGFTALPGGAASPDNGGYEYMYSQTAFWTATPSTTVPEFTNTVSLSSGSKLSLFEGRKLWGRSVRLVKDVN